MALAGCAPSSVARPWIGEARATGISLLERRSPVATTHSGALSLGQSEAVASAPNGGRLPPTQTRASDRRGAHDCSSVWRTIDSRDRVGDVRLVSRTGARRLLRPTVAIALCSVAARRVS